MAAVDLLVRGGATAVKADPVAAPVTVTVPLSGSEGAGIELLVRSYASGALTLANVVQEYQVS
jgi:hypothetical protein